MTSYDNQRSLTNVSDPFTNSCCARFTVDDAINLSHLIYIYSACILTPPFDAAQAFYNGSGPIYIFISLFDICNTYAYLNVDHLQIVTGSLTPYKEFVPKVLYYLKGRRVR